LGDAHIERVALQEAFAHFLPLWLAAQAAHMISLQQAAARIEALFDSIDWDPTSRK
jgi:hypothetical protein